MVKPESVLDEQTVNGIGSVQEKKRSREKFKKQYAEHKPFVISSDSFFPYLK